MSEKSKPIIESETLPPLTCNLKYDNTRKLVLSHINKFSHYFYYFLFFYILWGVYSTYGFINDYIEVQKKPKTLMNLYVIYHKEYLFLLSIFISVLFNGVLIYYVVKYIPMNKAKKYIQLIFTVSIILTFFKHIGISDYLSLIKFFSPIFFILIVLGNILFVSPYSVQNLTIFALWILILFPLHKKIFSNKIVSKFKLSIFVLALFINFLILIWFFPTYHITPIP